MTRIARAISEACDEIAKRDRWLLPDHYDAEDFNHGLCADVAEAVLSRIPGAHDRESYFAHHVFIEYRGRYYDSEAPEGVDHPNQLPIFRREFAAIRRTR